MEKWGGVIWGTAWVAVSVHMQRMLVPRGCRGEGRCRQKQRVPRLDLGFSKKPNSISSTQPKDRCPKGNILLLQRIGLYKGKADMNAFKRHSPHPSTGCCHPTPTMGHIIAIKQVCVILRGASGKQPAPLFPSETRWPCIGKLCSRTQVTPGVPMGSNIAAGSTLNQKTQFQ